MISLRYLSRNETSRLEGGCVFSCLSLSPPAMHGWPRYEASCPPFLLSIMFVWEILIAVDWHLDVVLISISPLTKLSNLAWVYFLFIYFCPCLFCPMFEIGLFGFFLLIYRHYAIYFFRFSFLRLPSKFLEIYQCSLQYLQIILVNSRCLIM